MVIPVHDENPVRRTPVVTYALIVVNAVVFLLEPVHQYFLGSQTAKGVCHQYAFFDKWAAIPKELLSNQPLGPHRYVVGTGSGQIACPVDVFPHKSPVLSVLYAMFLHAGWLHLLGNMLFLYIFGNNIEDRFGRVRLSSSSTSRRDSLLRTGSRCSTPDRPRRWSVRRAPSRASSAPTCCCSRGRKCCRCLPFLFFIPVRLPAWLVLGSWFVLQYFYAAGTGVSDGASVAYMAHVVGFVFGALIGYGVRRRAA